MCLLRFSIQRQLWVRLLIHGSCSPGLWCRTTTISSPWHTYSCASCSTSSSCSSNNSCKPSSSCIICNSFRSINSLVFIISWQIQDGRHFWREMRAEGYLTICPHLSAKVRISIRSLNISQLHREH